MTGLLVVAGVLALAGCRGAESRMAKKSDWTPPAADGADGARSRELAQNGADNPSNSFANRGPGGAPPPGGTLASRDRNSMPPAGMNGSMDGAAGARGRADRFDPVAEHLAQGRDELSRGNLEQARLHFTRVLKDVPNHTEANHRLAVIADKQQKWPEAELHYRAALRARPNDPNLHSDLGYSYLLQTRYADAEKELNAALKVDSGHTRALNNLGLLYGRQGDYPRALATFRRIGSEEEAQQKMARMFSDAPPAAMLANANAPNTNELSRVAAAGYQAEQQKLPSDPAAANAILAGIKTRMEEERRRGEAAREEIQARRNATALPNVGSPRPLPGLMPPDAAEAGMAYRRQPEGMLDEAEIEQARQAMARPYPGRGTNASLSQPDNMAARGMRADDNDPQATPKLGNPVVLSGGQSGNFAGNRPGQLPSRPVQIPESYAGRERRMQDDAASAYGPNPSASGVVNAGGTTADDVWPPKPTRGGKPSSIERTGFNADPRNAPPAAGRSPLAPTQSQLDAQRMATQIGMGAGPGGMFPSMDPRSDRGAPNGDRPNGPGPYGNAAGASASNYGPGHQPGADGPQGPPASWRREWRDDEQPILNDATMPPSGPSAATQSYQDHMSGGMSPDNPLYDPEHQAILNDLKRERQHLTTTPGQWNGSAGELQSNQFYSPMDASMQPYENMRTEARAAAHSPNGEDPRAGRPMASGQSFQASGAPNNPGNGMGWGPGPAGGANLDGSGYSMGGPGLDRESGANGMRPSGGPNSGVDDGAGYGAGSTAGYGANSNGPMPRGMRSGMGSSPAPRNPGNGVSPWGSSRGMDTYNMSRGR